MRRLEARQDTHVVEIGGDMVVESLPHLHSFSIGWKTPNVTRSDGKIVNVTWPWTGRLEEWSWEEVPEDRPGIWGPIYDEMEG